MITRFGKLDVGALVREMRQDTARTARFALTRDDVRIPQLNAYLDGLGSGVGDGKVRGVIYDQQGNVVAVGGEVIVPKGMSPAWKVLPFEMPGGVSLPAAVYDVGLIVGEADKVVRVYGDDPGAFVTTATRPLLRESTGNITDATRAAGTDGDGRGHVQVTNLITNGSFETDAATWAVVRGSITSSTDRSYHGTRSGKYVISTPGDAYISPGGDVNALRLGMVGGGTYTFSAWVYVPSGNGTTWSLRIFDGIGDGLGGVDYKSSKSADIATFDQWVRVSVTRTLRQGVTEAFVRLENNAAVAGQVVYIDAAQVEMGFVPHDYVHTNGAVATQTQRARYVNLIGNSSFETDSAGWSDLNANSTSVRDGSQSKYGVGSLKVAVTGGIPNAGPFWTINYAQGVTYTLSAWVKAPVGMGVCLGHNTTNGPTFAGTGDWQRITFTFTAAAGQNRVYVRQASGTPGTFWVDAVMAEYGSTAHDYAADWDYVPKDGSYGIYSSRTNLIANGGFENDVAGWTNYAAGTTTFSQEIQGSRFGTRSMRASSNPAQTLTETGGVITDATRALGVDGDGRSYRQVTNLIANSGFETNATGWTALAGTVARVTSDKQFGTACGQLTVAAADDRFRYIIPGYVPTQGQLVTASAWVKAGNAQAVGRVVHLRVNEEGGATPNRAMVTIPVTLTSQWQRVYATGAVTSSDRTSLVFYCGPIGTGVPGDLVLLDGAQVELDAVPHDYVHTDGAAATATVRQAYANLVPNGTFETDTSGWQQRSPTNGATLSRDTTQFQSGTASLKVVTAGAVANEGAQMIANQPALGAMTYTASFWLRVAAGTQLQAWLSASGVGQFGATNVITGTGAWQQVTFSATTPTTPGYSGFGAPLLLNVLTNATAAVTFNLDQVMLEVGPTAHAFAVGAANAPLDDTRGVWPAATNLLPNPGFETNATGWTDSLSFGPGVQAVARDLFTSRFGIASLRSYGIPGQTLTLSGNEITDATRAAGAQGDGRGYEYVFNQLSNGGFETNTTGWTVGGSGTAATLNRITSDKKFGSASGDLVVPSGGVGRGARYNFTFAANATYTASLWYKVVQVGAGATPTLISVYNTPQTSVSRPLDATIDGVWKRASVTFTTDATAQTSSYVELRINGTTTSGTYEVLIDGLQIEAGAVAHDYVDTNGAAAGAIQGPLVTNLLTNSGFEADAANWAAQGTGTIARTTSDSHSGGGSLLVTPDATGAEKGARYTHGSIGVPVAPGQALTATCWIKGTAGKKYRLNLNEQDINNVFLLTQRSNTILGSDFTATGSWQKISVTFAPTSAATRRVLLFVLTGLADSTPYLVDDVQLETGTVASAYVESNGAITSTAVGSPDGSTGMWPAATNLCPNGGFETNTTGWTGVNGGTLARDTAAAKFGSSSLRIAAPGAVSDEGAWLNTPRPAVSGGTAYTFSAWVLAPIGATFALIADEFSAGAHTQYDYSATFVGTGAWQRVSLTVTTLAGTDAIGVGVITRAGAQAITFWVDGVQLEAGSVATPYVHTNGATATRGNARAQAPARVLNAGQGWVAMRVRMGYATSGAPIAFPRFFEWGTSDFNNRVVLFFRQSTGQFAASRLSGGSGAGPSIAAAKSPGDYVTLVLAWTPTQVMLSVDGSVFTKTANTNIPDLSAISTVNVGCDLNGNEQQYGDTLWFTSGLGTLTDADAATLNALANAEPTNATLPAAAQTSAVMPMASSAWFDYSNAYPTTRTTGVTLSSGLADLTLAGGEMPDSARAAAVQGDGTGYEYVYNLIPNGSFETSINAGSSWFDNGTGSTVTRDTTDKMFGSASLKTSKAGGPSAAMGVSVDVAANAPYTVSAWVKCDVAGATCNVYYVERTSADVFVANRQQQFVSTGGWQRVSYTWTPSAGNTKARVAFAMGAAVTNAWIDGVQIEAGSVAHDPVATDGAAAGLVQGPLVTNLLLNSGAEMLTGGAQSWSSGTATRDTAQAQSGATSFRVNSAAILGSGATMAGGGSLGRVPVVGGQTYTYSLWMRGSVGGESVRLQVAWYDSSGTAISTSSGSNLALTTAWARYSFTATAPANSTQAWLPVTNATASAQVWYIDSGQFELGTSASAYIETGSSPGASAVGVPLGAMGVWPAATNLVLNGGAETGVSNIGQAGINAPASWAVQPVAGAGTGLTGTFSYRESAYGQNGVESGVNGSSAAVTVANKDVTVTLADVSNNDAVGRKLYRTSDGGATWKLVATIPGIASGATYTDNTPDGSLSTVTPPTSAQGWAQIARDTTVAKFGTASLRVMTPGGVANEGAFFDIAGGLARAPGQVVTGSAWVKGIVGQQVRAWVRVTNTDSSISDGPGTTITFDGTWQRIVAPVQTVQAGKTGDRYSLMLRAPSVQVGTFWVDGAQLEESSFATPYVHTNGAAASRANSRIQGSSSVLSAAQGWAAVRFRVGFNSGSEPSGFPAIFEWKTDGNNRLSLYWGKAASKFAFDHFSGGTNESVSEAATRTFNAGDVFTVVVAWTATTVSLSVNGGAFVTRTTTLPLTPSLPTFDIGSFAGASGWLNSEILWAMTGTGPLPQSDANALAATTADPTAATVSAGALPTAVFDMSSAVSTAIPGAAYTFSGWLQAPPGYTFRGRALAADFQTSYGLSTFTTTGRWQRFTTPINVPRTGTVYNIVQPDSATAEQFRFAREQPGGAFYMDGMQLEAGAQATPYTPSARLAGRVSTGGRLLGGAQGWVAVRARPQFSSSAVPSNSRLWWYAADGSGTNRISGGFIAGGVQLVSNVNGSSDFGTVNTTWNAGDELTLIFAWTTTQLLISVNGGSFQAFSRPSGIVPASSSTYSFDVGSQQGTSGHLNGEELWVGTGLGPITNTDAAAIHALLVAGTEPTIAQLPVSTDPTSSMPMATASFTDRTQYPTARTTGQAASSGLADLTIASGTITDATRAAVLTTTSSGQMMDGLLSDGSMGVRRAATNLHPRGQVDTAPSQNYTFSTSADTGVTSAIDATVPPPFGPQAFRVNSQGVSTQGIVSRTNTGLNLAAGTPVVGSVYFRGVAGSTYRVFIRVQNTDSTTDSGPTTTFTATGGWQLLAPAAYAVQPGKTGDALRIDVTQTVAAAETLRVAHPMIEQGQTVVSPYVATSGGSTATHPAGRVQAPTALLGATQGWIAMRFRYGWSSTQAPLGGSGFDIVANVSGPGASYFRLMYREASSDWRIRLSDGVTSWDSNIVPGSFNAGDVITLVATYAIVGGVQQVRLSLNGSAFAAAGVSTMTSLSPVSFDIGSLNGAAAGLSGHAPGEVLWAASGTGTLTNADAAALNALGNAAPSASTLPTTAAITASMPMDTAVYDAFPGQPYTFSTWALAPAGTQLTAAIYRSDFVSLLGQNVVTATGFWQRIEVTGYATRNETVYPTLLSSRDFYGGSFLLDGAQLEQGAFSTPYIATNGAQASRPDGWAKVDPRLFAREQGFVSVRIRLGAAPSAIPLTSRVFDFRQGDNQNFADTRWASGGWSFLGIGTQSSAGMAKGDEQTITMAWDTDDGTLTGTPGTGVLHAWFNGTYFGWAPRTLTDIYSGWATLGNFNEGGAALNGEILWAVAGTRKPTTAEVAALHATPQGSDPAFADAPEQPSFVWPASTGLLIVSQAGKLYADLYADGPRGDVDLDLLDATHPPNPTTTSSAKWQLYGVSNANASIDPAQTHGGGSGALKLTSVADGAGVTLDLTAAAAGSTPVPPNTSVLARAWVRPSAASQAKIQIREYDAAGVFVKQTPLTQILTPNAWNSVAATIETGPTTAYIDVQVLNSSGGVVGTMWFDDASVTLPVLPLDEDLSIHATVFPVWKPVDENVDDFYRARLPFPEAQAEFARIGPLASTSVLCTAGWHGTNTDPERGSFAIVRTGGPLADLVGQRIRVATRRSSQRHVVYAFVHAEADIEEDVSLTRRGFQALGALGEGEQIVSVEVLG